MKVSVRFKEEEEIPNFETKYGLEVENDKGQRYIIEFDNFGNLVVNRPEGSLLVKPEYGNQISIRPE
nr:MAG: hypothetical protein [Bacteriophage sp.]